MCTIRDIVEIRAVNPPVQLWTVRKGYTLFRDDDNRLCATFSDVSGAGCKHPVPHKRNTDRCA